MPLKVKFIYAHKWAIYFLIKGIQKHSKHSVDLVHYSKLTLNDAMKYDVIFCVNNLAWERIEKRLGRKLTDKLVERRKVICSVASKKNSRAALKTLKRVKFRCIRVPSSVIKKYLESIGCPLEIRIGEPCVDTEFFKPLNTQKEGFTIGWAGKYHRKEKRTHLLRQLGYPLKIARGNVPRSEMANFYNSIDTYVHVSSTEGAPTVALEAMACGLPVVSTRVGLIPRLLEKEWIVPVNKEKVVEAIREKLSILETDIDLRRTVGQRNLMEIRRGWTCEILAKKWDNLFEV